MADSVPAYLNLNLENQKFSIKRVLTYITIQIVKFIIQRIKLKHPKVRLEEKL